jgi:hypothetical protein
VTLLNDAAPRIKIGVCAGLPAESLYRSIVAIWGCYTRPGCMASRAVTSTCRDRPSIPGAQKNANLVAVSALARGSLKLVGTQNGFLVIGNLSGKKLQWKHTMEPTCLLVKLAIFPRILLCLFIYCNCFKIYRTITSPVVLYGCETWSLTLREKLTLRVFENKVLGV